LIGSDNIVDGGSGNQLNVSGTENILTFGTQSSVNLAASTDNIVAMSDGTVTLGTNGAALLVGSGNTLNMTVGGYTEIDGNNNVINAVTGDIVVLDAGDSGDTINMLGGTVVAASGVSNITIDGSLNDVVGPGASSVTQGDPTFQEIISFFSANPDLPQTQITEAESGPSYQSELSSFIATANLADFSPGLIAMLYGYSSLELSLLGINASVFSEAATIEQDFVWGTENAPVPTDNLTQVLQNLLPALIDTNPETQDMVTLALSELALSRIEEPGGLAAGLLGLPTPGSPVIPVPPQPNVDQIVISDTVAKLALEIAEQPDDAKTGNLVEKVRLPNKSDPYEIVVTPGYPAGDQVLVKNEHGTFFHQVLNDVDQYVAPIVDLLALATGQPELILAASALSLVEAGQDFASGNDVGGIFSVIGAAGGGLGAFGKLSAFASSADDTLAEDIGQYLTDASNIGSGADGAVVAIDTGNILGGLSSGFSALAAIGGALEEFGAPGPLGVGDSTVSKFGSELANTATIAIGADQIAYAAETGSITSAINGLFEAAGGAAALQNDTTAQKFALLGEDLASVAEASDEAANGQGSITTDIFAALTSLVKSQQEYSALGGFSGIITDINNLWLGFAESYLGLTPSMITLGPK